jgi:hypothetical protein
MESKKPPRPEPVYQGTTPRYEKDLRTDLCFAFFVEARTNVPCTSKVEELVGKESK